MTGLLPSPLPCGEGQGERSKLLFSETQGFTTDPKDMKNHSMIQFNIRQYENLTENR
jgi:hypothetical protein